MNAVPFVALCTLHFFQRLKQHIRLFRCSIISTPFANKILFQMVADIITEQPNQQSFKKKMECFFSLRNQRLVQNKALNGF